MMPNTVRSVRSAFGAILCIALVLGIKAEEGRSSMEAMENGLSDSPSRHPFDRSSLGELPVVEEGSVERKCDCVCGVSHHTRIVGGIAAGRMEFPWLVAIFWYGSIQCGGSLITDRHVLTAAHCLDKKDYTVLSIEAGGYDIFNATEKVQKRFIKKVAIHRDFNDTNFDSDIAVVELDQPVTFGDGNIGTACLPSETYREYDGEYATAVGRGRNMQHGVLSPIPLKVDVPLMTLEDCRLTAYGRSEITDNMLCAGFLAGKKGTCKGDSGGPLNFHIANPNTSTMEVVGIVSSAIGCARPNHPTIYTRVQQFVPWIRAQIAGACECARV